MNEFSAAVKYSFPVFLGYITIGIAFGLLMADAGYPWPLALLASLVMYAGAGQYAAVGLLAAGAGLAECLLVQLVINARHTAYSLTMLNRFRNAGPYRHYLIFALTDETFALLSSLGNTLPGNAKHAPRFMFFVSLLDHLYWTAGSVMGALAGTFIPFSTAGIGFALTALFIVLMMEQIFRQKDEAPSGDIHSAVPSGNALRGTSFRPALFIIPAISAVLTVIFFPPRTALLGAMALSLALIQLKNPGRKTA